MIKLKKIYTKPINNIIKELGIGKQGRVQKYLDKRVAENLQPYVSFKSGTQEGSIKLATVYGEGKVKIWVNYAEIQAYAKWIKKRVGKRGTYPFERMYREKAYTILREVGNYARRIS